MVQALGTGTVFAGQTVVKVLGHGGFGITYLTQDNKSGQHYALKEYFPSEMARRDVDNGVRARPERTADFDLGRQAFFDEARTLQALPRQRGLVKVRGAFERHRTVYCLMEHVDGWPLDHMLAAYARDGRTVAEELVGDFVRAIASALGAVHAKGLIHRDVKPANIMIRRSDHEPVLIDFGASRHLNRATDLAAIFTREYAPIEQLPLDWSRLRLREGPWTDLFSLSIVLHRMLTFGLPLNSLDRLTELQSTGRDPYVPVAKALEDARPGVRYSRELTDLIDFGCRLLPADRPANALAFAELLRGGSRADPSRLRTHEHFGSADPVSDITVLREAVTAIGARVRNSGAVDAAVPTQRPARVSRIVVALVLLITLAALAYAVSSGAVRLT